MSLSSRFQSIRAEYPRQFWILFIGSLINSAGSGLVFPFFSLFFTQKLGYSMTDVGIVFALYAGVSMLAQVVGGSLVDRIGRKPIMVVSLFVSAVTTLGLGLTELLGHNTPLIYLLALTVLTGLSGSIFSPAVNAMVADLVTPGKRTPAYGLLRVVQNLGVAVGPAIGGFIAVYSYLALFTLAALASLVYGVIVALLVRETMPSKLEGHFTGPSVTPAPTNDHFSAVLSDRVLLTFCALFAVALIVWSQATTTLPVYLNRTFGVSEQWYGLLMSVNATMVVLLQFPITRFTDRFNRAAMMSLGALFFSLGFGMYAVVSVLPLFFVAQATWTMGEMIATPVSQAFVADIAPATMRGRYMGVYGLVYTVAFGVGPLLGGAVMDSIGGRYIWLGGIVLSLLAATGFMLLSRRMQRPAATTVQEFV